VRREELTIRKAGRSSIVTHDDLMAWINSLPVKGKGVQQGRSNSSALLPLKQTKQMGDANKQKRIQAMHANPSERRRQLRLNRQKREVIDALQRGETLHCMHSESGPRWRLSAGRAVSADVARLVIANTSVNGDGDALFPGACPQTFRWIQ
jgi:hypothetical protein